MNGCRALCWLLIALLAANSTAQAEFDARMKWFGSATWLPPAHVDRVLGGVDQPGLDQNLDLRLMWRSKRGPLSVQIDHATGWINGDSAGASATQNLNQVVISDRARLADLTWRLDRGDRHVAWHRLDRLNLRWEQGNWSLTAGRQAVSWGNGLVFQPMDLFNPFTPTAVDRDFKPGSDLLLFERVFADGSDVQLLAVARRDSAGAFTGRAGSLAGKYRGIAGAAEYELLAGRHYDDSVLGVALRLPLGGALLRSDWVFTQHAGDVTLTAVMNLDYSFALFERGAYVFAEFFYNGFGVNGREPELLDIPSALNERLQRGELFNLQRRYLALGATYQLHPLWTGAATLITNLHDASTIVQTQFSFEPGDKTRLELGLLASVGSRGEEFGGPFVASALLRDTDERPLLAGGATQAFVRWVYYF